MFKGTYKMADTVFEIVSVYEFVQKLCNDFSSNEEAEFSLEISKDDIEFENNGDGFSPDYLETLAVYRKLCNKLIEKNILLFHASAVCVDGFAYMFLAKSGVGKSTHTFLYTKAFKDRAIMINDDKPLVKIEDGAIVVYGSAWNGKHNRGNNVSFPLKAVCFLERGKDNEIEEISFKDSFGRLIEHSYSQNDEAFLRKKLLLLDKMNYIKFYSLKCNTDEDAAFVSFEKMKGDLK